MPIEPEPITMLAYCDFAAQVRGKGFPARDLEARLASGIGWTPTNIMINCFRGIPATPWGPRGDLLLKPDPATEIRLDFGDGLPPAHWLLSDVVGLDGSPWACCPRSFLKAALVDLEREAGLRLLSAFEHELWCEALADPPGSSYGLAALRGAEGYVAAMIGALRAAGLEPETVLPEYGPGQLEVTVAPSFGIEAADRAVALREVCRTVAGRRGVRVSFAPVVSWGVVGNGVHLHLSLWDLDGRPVTWDAAGPKGLSPVAGSFAAGVLRHVRALSAVTAPSVASYARLRPNAWAAYWGNLGWRDREACLRICPVPETPGADPAPAYNLEFRVSDATANPYLVLGMLARAGLQGIREGLAAPEPLEVDPETLGAEGRAARGILDLPRSLDEALDALEADATARAWLPPALLEAYVMHKRGESAAVAGLDPEEVCRRYAEAY
jgi:glutamine synthetase